MQLKNIRAQAERIIFEENPRISEEARSEIKVLLSEAFDIVTENKEESVDLDQWSGWLKDEENPEIELENIRNLLVEVLQFSWEKRQIQGDFPDLNELKEGELQRIRVLIYSVLRNLSDSINFLREFNEVVNRVIKTEFLVKDKDDEIVKLVFPDDLDLSINFEKNEERWKRFLNCQDISKWDLSEDGNSSKRVIPFYVNNWESDLVYTEDLPPEIEAVQKRLMVKYEYLLNRTNKLDLPCSQLYVFDVDHDVSEEDLSGFRASPELLSLWGLKNNSTLAIKPPKSRVSDFEFKRRENGDFLVVWLMDRIFSREFIWNGNIWEFYKDL